MRAYEVTYIIDPQLEDEQIDAAVEQLNQIITANGGEIGEIDKWGKRRLAYEVAEKNEGYYVVVTFDGGNNTLDELDRFLKLNENYIRHIIIRRDSEG
ncbi:MAG: 30S ribosomal protein S6 [bacterium]|jgi:small subunit ribosomal protein S6|nr:30S ribosomal protein S6 [bacterium]MDD3805035.1 30S ribosomal protein S6 [bacterium]MDD4152437.1 30S ribosomal protein S6 [bacterium]MDD4558649.1 30S ribosomal protein S6 [bacterium]